ncbi:TonB-dependent receptor [Leptobacterium flavescens]|uniref:TonB-dependent receptor n=2 Tax=Leptobacterium flavescens TaxID=472055 RepID=A0A6P0URM7_9FLAO|nr:TonB-dependent receptor [Leptobacterium flavescens]
MRKAVAILLFFFTYISYSQSVKVIDSETNEPVPNVVVYNQGKTKTRSTDVNGAVDLSIFSDNEKIIFRLFGYREKRVSKKQALSDNGVVKLIPQSEKLDEVVLSISKWEQQKRDIPQKINSIKSEEIAFANPQTSADLLQNSGQVYVQKSQLGGGSPIIRGFATNRLLLTVDGVRMNTAIFRGGNVQNVISIDPFTIQRTEVIFGPGSVIYGSDAIGGVLNFYTKEAQQSRTDSLLVHGNAFTRYATANDEKTVHADLNFGWKKWAFLSSFSYSDFDDLRQGRHGPDEFLRTFFVDRVNGEDVVVQNDDPLIQRPSGYSQINFLQKVKFTPNETWDFNLGLIYTSTSNYARYDRLIELIDGLPRSAEWFYGPQRWFMGNFQVNKKGNTKWYDNARLTLAYQHFEESRNDRNFQSDIFNRNVENVDAYSANLDLEKKFDDKTKLFYGLEYVLNTVDSEGSERNIVSGELSEAQSRYPDGSTWQTFAAFVNLEHKIKPNLSLLSGVRYSYVSLDADFDNRFFDFPFTEANVKTGAFTGSVGISWLPEENLQITLNGSTAFRAPNIDDVGRIFDSEPGSVVVPNPDLEPEYAYNAEFGIRKNFNNRVSFSFATFYTLLDNALVRRDFELNGQRIIDFQGEPSNVQAIQNAARAFSYGFEFGLDAYFTDRLSFMSNLTLTKGREELDDGSEAALRHVAPLFADAHLVWDNNKLKLDFFLNYNGEISFEDLAPSERNKPFLYAIDENGNPFAASWYTLNLRSQYKITQNLESNVSLENITDQRYRTYSSGISAAGRNLILGLKYYF